MAAPPVGDLVVAFTGVEGPDGVDAHDQLVPELTDVWGGYVVKAEPAAFMVAFASAATAVRWAVALQEALAAWPAARVRIGAHLGSPECRVDAATGRMDYFGRSVNRAARIAAAAHGGQVLIGGRLRDAALAEIGDLVLLDLGEHRLRGLERPERLWSVASAALAGRVHPPPATLALHQTNLERHPTRFVGRDTALEGVEKAVRAQRIVTVLGPGGMGKTRLVSRYGGLSLASWPGGVWFCDLSEVVDREGLVRIVGSALGLVLSGEDPAPVALAIAGRGRMLLLLDNFENLIAEAPVIARWRDAAPQAVFLVTSRQRLGVQGEHVLELLPLPAETAIALFEARAREAVSTFALTDENRAAVAEVVRRLDGIPLAIELAAARVRVMSPARLLERMPRRFEVLTSSRRDANPRQATLRGAIAWSWNLLTPWEQAALAQASVFRGGIEEEAAAAVIDLSAWPDAPALVAVVATLREKSLLRASEPLPGLWRYVFYESIREFAAERLLEAGGAGTGPAAAVGAERRHGAWFARWGSRGADDDAERDATQALDIDNLLAAVERAIARGDATVAAGAGLAVQRLMSLRGPVEAGVALGARLLALPDLDPADRQRISSTQGRVLVWLGRSAEARQVLEGSLADARAAGAPLPVAQLRSLARLLRDEGRHDEARARLDEALAVIRAEASAASEGSFVEEIAVLEALRGDFVAAERFGRQALAILEGAGAEHRAALARLNVGLVTTAQGRLGPGIDDVSAAIGVLARYGNRIAQGSGLLRLASLLADRGDFDGAEARLAEGGVVLRAIADASLEVELLSARARLWLDEGRVAEAQPLVERCLAIEQARARRRQEPTLLQLFGEIGLLTGHQSAVEALRTARDGFRAGGQRVNEAYTRTWLAIAERDLVELDAAEAVLEAGGAVFWRAHAQVARAEIHGALGDALSARAAVVDARARVDAMSLGPLAPMRRRLAAVEASIGR